ncbi:hypothetical protein [Staphylococcus epidermidis]|nr:hypothetical protein [Staphylococcus epidermidis]
MVEGGRVDKIKWFEEVGNGVIKIITYGGEVDGGRERLKRMKNDIIS